MKSLSRDSINLNKQPYHTIGKIDKISPETKKKIDKAKITMGRFPKVWTVYLVAPKIGQVCISGAKMALVDAKDRRLKKSKITYGGADLVMDAAITLYEHALIDLCQRKTDEGIEYLFKASK